MKKVIYLLFMIFSLWLMKQVIPILKLEGYFSWISAQLYNGNTTYAPGYTDRKFLKIKKGMSERQVKAILGEPLTIWEREPGYIGLCYTKECECNYHIRQIFIHEGKVAEVVSWYYLD